MKTQYAGSVLPSGSCTRHTTSNTLTIMTRNNANIFPANNAIRAFSSFCMSFVLFAAILAVFTPASAFSAAQEQPDTGNRQLLDKARAALAAGRESNALSDYRKVLEAQPDNQEALQAAGDILIKQGKYDDASIIYLRLLRLKPDDGKALLRMGLIRQQLGQPYEAQATLSRALEGRGLSEEEAAQARQALDAIYSNWEVLNIMQAKNDNPAQERFHSYQISKAPDTAVVSYALRGFVRHSLHRPEEALKDFNTALSMGGMDEGLRKAVLLSKSEIEKGRESEQLWEKIHKTASELEAKNDKQGLEDFYTSLLDNEPARVFAAVNRAFLRVARNDYDGAESDLNYALQANPDDKAKADIEKGLRLVAELRQGSDQNMAREKAESLKAEMAVADTKPAAAAGDDKTAEKPARESRAPAPYVDPYPLFDNTDRLIQQRNYGQAEAVMGKLRRLPLKNEEKGIYLYYRAELDWHKGEPDKAYQGYKKASRMVKEKYRRSAILARMAEYFVRKDDKKQAAEYAKRSADLLPNEAWKMAQVAGIFNSIDMNDEAVAYYEKTLAMRPEPGTSANAFMGLAETYKKKKDQQSYLRHAREYIDTVKAPEGVFSDEEKGLAAFYEGEIFAAGNDQARAFQSYEAASRLLKEKYRLSETYVKMAKYQAGQGNSQMADSYAESSVTLLPDQPWRIREAVGIFRDTGNIEKADTYARRAIALNPTENGGLYQELANLHLDTGDRDYFLTYNANYIDYLLEQMEKSGKKASTEDILRLHEARKRQKEVSRTWGFASYNYYSRTNSGDYFYGMTNELYREFRLANGRYGKFYGQYVGTVTSYFSGDYLDRTTMKKSSWESRQHWNDSAHGILGVQIHPFTTLYDLSFDAEYVFPLHDGKNKDDDFRVRISYGWTEGDEPMPIGNVWDYMKLNTSATYSFRDGDVTSSYSFNGGDVSAGTELRYGKTLVSDFDRNFLTIPFIQFKANYLGRKRDPGERWQLEAGPSILLKKWFNEDKYHTPKSSVEVQFYYNWGLNGRHENTFGINAAISF